MSRSGSNWLGKPVNDPHYGYGMGLFYMEESNEDQKKAKKKSKKSKALNQE